MRAHYIGDTSDWPHDSNTRIITSRQPMDWFRRTVDGTMQQAFVWNTVGKSGDRNEFIRWENVPTVGDRTEHATAPPVT